MKNLGTMETPRRDGLNFKGFNLKDLSFSQGLRRVLQVEVLAHRNAVSRRGQMTMKIALQEEVDNLNFEG